MTEIQAAQTVLVTALEGNTNLVSLLAAPIAGQSSNIFADIAPQEASYPFVLLQFIPGDQDETYGTDESLAMARMLFIVKGCVEGQDQTKALAIAEQIHQTIQSLSDDLQQWRFNCFRRSSFYLPEFRESKHYRQAGGRYTVLARPLA